MVKKKALNLAVPEGLLRQFYTVSAAYGHGKQKGMVLAAAIAMFLDAKPQEQGEYLERVMQAEIQEGVTRLMDQARAQQSLDEAAGAAMRQAADQEPRKIHSPEAQPRPRKAAKKKGESKRGFRGFKK